jgi:hypothetical protein
MTKILGSLRRSSFTEAEVVLATGVYLTFRLDANKQPFKENLVEVKRFRMGSAPGDFIVVDPRLLRSARQEACRAIIAHRATIIRLPEPVEQRYRKPHQLSFMFAI